MSSTPFSIHCYIKQPYKPGQTNNFLHKVFLYQKKLSILGPVQSLLYYQNLSSLYFPAGRHNQKCIGDTVHDPEGFWSLIKTIVFQVTLTTNYKFSKCQLFQGRNRGIHIYDLQRSACSLAAVNFAIRRECFTVIETRGIVVGMEQKKNPTRQGYWKKEQIYAKAE